jgi:hypothetical protein
VYTVIYLCPPRAMGKADRKIFGQGLKGGKNAAGSGPCLCVLSACVRAACVRIAPSDDASEGKGQDQHLPQRRRAGHLPQRRRAGLPRRQAARSQKFSSPARSRP